MTTKLKQFIVSVRQKEEKKTFFQLARQNIVKKKKSQNRDLSKRVDEIVYGV